MTKEEFLHKLSQTPREWRLCNEQLRLDAGNVWVCPITAVAGGELPVMQFEEAAEALELDPALTAAIVCAADNYFGPGHLALRRELLAACGITEA